MIIGAIEPAAGRSRPGKKPSPAEDARKHPVERRRRSQAWRNSTKQAKEVAVEGPAWGSGLRRGARAVTGRVGRIAGRIS
jgi:hypothetical protein